MTADVAGYSSLDRPPEKILQGAQEADLESVVVVGFTKDGKEFFASSEADGAEVMWSLQRAIWRLNRICDQMAGSDDGDAA